MAKNYWLMKSEPTTYGIDHLIKEPNMTTSWEGVRNYQARNFMMNEMKKGDLAFFYHSNAQPPGIVGLMEIHSEAHPDTTCFNSKSPYYDSKSTEEKPIWFCVDVKLIKKYPSLLPLETLRKNKKLKNMILLQKGSRLSVQPVVEKDFQEIIRMLGQNL